MDLLSFSSLPLKKPLLDNLQLMEFSSMTPIQAQSLPLILTGKDVIAKAKTGSGKTVAFGLGILSKLNVEQFTTQALVICPTRELADQVANEIRRLARLMNNVKVLTLCGGVPIGPQIGSLEHSAHIIIGTPGRLVDHLQRQSLDLSHLNLLVLDEADRMLEMGFEDDIERILTNSPVSRQTLLFSATYPDNIMQMSKRMQNSPEMISVDEQNNEIEQYFYEIDNYQRDQALAKIINLNPCESTIVFCNTKIACQEVEAYLNKQGFSAIALHGDLEQKEREQVLFQFANKSRAILVATDVAARGLDIKELDVVINYQITPDPEVHVHRVGRTGRAGAKGLAVTLVATNEIQRANMIEEVLNSKLVWQTLPNLTIDSANIVQPNMQTICLTIGRKNKIRPGDILGALTKDANLDGKNIGKINITELYTYVAIHHNTVKQMLTYFKDGKIKGKTVRARKL
ncbi:ATP-dependent RNA helicase DbpA [Zophobihabitans entericus]|uniref:ATP-dependent RNA helicase DbpA n=1 Tax=Zophobihabitans entericus TaxID=1635327 RepID=A0A6G9ICS3_9GAMM|nr:ATP-dependent RNA helicase DbpA [Zophobihabitans entericus]QIQ22023.1 ATP-dependent RNA helicase DbpA [Zophobihabitans entericus]